MATLRLDLPERANLRDSLARLASGPIFHIAKWLNYGTILPISYLSASEASCTPRLPFLDHRCPCTP